MLEGAEGSKVALQSKQGKELCPVSRGLPGLGSSLQLAVRSCCPACCHQLTLQL